MCLSATHWCWTVAAVVLLVVAGPHPSRAQSAPADTVAAAADTLPPGHPNRVPYRSERSVVEHVLAAPAYALHYATRPLGWAVKEAEQRFPQVFEGNLPSYGAYPLFETGGASGFAGGAVLFYNDLPWSTPSTSHNADVRALIGSRAYNRFEGGYEMTGLFGGTTRLGLEARHANDPRERFYIGGNDADEEDDRRFYALRETNLQLAASADWSARVETDARLRFQRARIDPGAAAIDEDDGDGEVRLPVDAPGVGTSNLASAEADVTFDWTSRTARSVEGTRLRLGAAYTQDLDGSANPQGEDDVRFLRYRAEAVQFVPLPFLPPERRLALRGLVEKAEPLGGGRVPFYRRPSLGGTERLRGYRTNRFRDEGALLLTAEYRWPVWRNLDAVLFAETGQVFSRYGDLALDRFHTGYGGGFHLVTGGRLAFRLELAGSPEGLRTVLTVQPAF